MRKILTILTILSCLLMVSCVQKNLHSESGLYDVELKEHLKAPTDGIWTWGKGNPYSHQQSGFIYISPLDISMIKLEHRDTASLMRPQMHDYMVQSFVEILQDANRENGTNWQLTFDPAQAHIRIDTALVNFRPQVPGLRVLSKVAGNVVSFPGVGTFAGKFSKGDITIEAAIRDNKTNQLLLALKDSNRKTTRLYTAEAYSKTGNADVNLQSWARVLAHLCRLAWYDNLGDSTLQEKFKDYTYAESLIDRFKY